MSSTTRREILIKIEIPPGVDKDEFKRRVEVMMMEASWYHIALGGSGLKVEQYDEDNYTKEETA